MYEREPRRIALMLFFSDPHMVREHAKWPSDGMVCIAVEKPPQKKSCFHQKYEAATTTAAKAQSLVGRLCFKVKPLLETAWKN